MATGTVSGGTIIGTSDLGTLLVEGIWPPSGLGVFLYLTDPDDASNFEIVGARQRPGPEQGLDITARGEGGTSARRDIETGWLVDTPPSSRRRFRRRYRLRPWSS